MPKLTKTAIDRARYLGAGGSRDVRWDSAVPGLGLRVYPSGKKAFVVSYRFRGRKRLATVGTYGAMTLDQARTRASRMLVQAKDGNDPLEERRRERAGETLRDLIRQYLDRHAKPRKRSWEADQRRLERHVPPHWHGRRLNAFTRSDIAQLHLSIGLTKPYEANRVLQLLYSMFRFARLWGMLPNDAINPAADIERFREHSRERWLTPEELPRLATAIDAQPNIHVRGALWLYLLTGLRRAELINAKWEHIDRERGTLRLPETKSGKAQTVTLSGAALAILQSIPKLPKNPHIFPGREPGAPFASIGNVWRKVRTAAKLPDLQLHDLRRSVGSWLTQAGTDLNLIKHALRHQNISTTLVYARLGQDAAKEAMEAHGRRVLDAAKRPPIVGEREGA